MKKLNILLWVSLILVLVSCEHEPEEPEDIKLALSFSKTNCYEEDTLHIRVFVNDEPYSGKVKWNQKDIFSSGDEHLLIIPHIHSESKSVTLTAKVEKQKASQVIRITKRAFKYPIISYQNTIQPLLNGNCNFSGCHGNGSRAGKIELSCYDSTMNSVAPYNAKKSVLYSALIKTDPLRVMPPAGKLHDYKIEDVRLWIEQGAKHN